MIYPGVAWAVSRPKGCGLLQHWHIGGHLHRPHHDPVFEVVTRLGFPFP
jgi:hypothetical protein